MHKVHDGYPGDLTQGLMELGAPVCTPKNPNCDACPCVPWCLAHAEGQPERFPQSKKRVKPKPMSGVSAVVMREGKVLACQRSGEGLLGGLWEPVMGETVGGEADGEALERVLAQRVGLEGVEAREMGVVTHVFSHRRLTCRVFLVEVKGACSVRAGEGYQATRWVSSMGGVAWSVLGKKLLRCAGAQELLEPS